MSRFLPTLTTSTAAFGPCHYHLLTRNHNSLCKSSFSPTSLDSLFSTQQPVIFSKEFKKLFIFRERGGQRREKEREKNIDGCFSCMTQPEARPATQACAMTGNQTGNLLLCWTTASQLSHTGQGLNLTL